jgi:tRNA (cytidine/uridine-2'-O-)-methyltransferase
MEFPRVSGLWDFEDTTVDSKENPILRIVLYQPEIHPNTGNIARLCAANGIPLYLVGRLGFRVDDRAVRRAGLDYWPYVDLHRKETLDDVSDSLPGGRFLYFSTKGPRDYTEESYRRGDCLVFGSESKGLPPAILERNAESVLRIPMLTASVRSLNLANAVSIGMYEALRQLTRGRAAGAPETLRPR